jgi:hypothetical protein
VQEQDTDARPAIANPLASIDAFDTILLASPIWNVRAPMIMTTFAERYDFAGKTVHPLTTYAMSGLGTTPQDYAGDLPGRTHRHGPRGPRRAGTLSRRGHRRVAAPHTSARRPVVAADQVVAPSGSSTKSSAARSGSMWLALMKATTLRPVRFSMLAMASSLIAA